jgi:hypothetical protein
MSIAEHRNGDEEDVTDIPKRKEPVQYGGLSSPPPKLPKSAAVTLTTMLRDSQSNT